MRLYFVSILGGTLCGSPLTAQVLLQGGDYRQDFDSITSGLPSGWSVWTNATRTSLGAEASFETNTTSWAATSAQFRNCASVTNNTGLLDTNAAAATQHTFTNRVLAVRQGTSFGDPGAAFVLRLANTLGWSNLQFSADMMMLDEEGRETIWTVDYGLGLTPSSFISLGTCTNTGTPGTIQRPTFTLGPDANNQPQVVTLRIAALDPATGTGSRDTCGLDNVRLAGQSAASASVPLDIKRTDSGVELTWPDPEFSLQAASAPWGEYTNVPGAGSPHSHPLNGGQMFFRLVK
ncbi:MAG: hypothetical protein MUE94_00915 [Verrucomicrobia bacterium]|jgi:hypothetical protein|nr:hypothetical protein [Verrucomicrobiota bacterium]